MSDFRPQVPLGRRRRGLMIGLGVDVGGTNTDIILTGLPGGGTLVDPEKQDAKK